jgi:putative hemolysin
MIAHPLVILIVLVILLGISAFFSGSETALMSISKIRLRHLVEEKPKRVQLIERVLKKPERLIGAILLGNNLVNVAMSALATALAISLWGEKGILYVTVVLTFSILIFAEITPKVYAKYFNERVSMLAAPILNMIMILLNPVVVGVTYISTKMLAVTGVDITKLKRPLFTEAEVITCIKMAWDEGSITTEERKILSRVFALNDKTVGQVMIPKEQMTVLDINAPVQDVIKTIMKTGHSRFPVSRGEKLNIVGFIHGKDVLTLVDDKRFSSIKKIIRPPYFISADEKIDSQLRSFQARKLHQAVILDNRGSVVGLITLEDILEELVGAIEDEHDFT